MMISDAGLEHTAQHRAQIKMRKAELCAGPAIMRAGLMPGSVEAGACVTCRAECHARWTLWARHGTFPK